MYVKAGRVRVDRRQTKNDPPEVEWPSRAWTHFRFLFWVHFGDTLLARYCQTLVRLSTSHMRRCGLRYNNYNVGVPSGILVEAVELSRDIQT